jgi:hypothetical protein
MAAMPRAQRVVALAAKWTGEDTVRSAIGEETETAAQAGVANIRVTQASSFMGVLQLFDPKLSWEGAKRKGAKR